MWPLFCSQLNTILIWTCSLVVQLGLFRSLTSGQLQVKGSVFRNFGIRFFLSHIFVLEPLTVFFYTWKFIPTLEVEEENQFIR